MVFHIALKDLKIIFKDKKALAIMLLMPSAIIFILGAAFSSAFSGEAAVSSFSVAVVDNDDGVFSDYFISFLKDDLSELLDTRLLDESEAMKAMEDGDVASVIVIPEGFSDGIMGYRPVKMEVRSPLESRFKAGIVEGIVNGYAQAVSMGSSVAVAADRTLSGYGSQLAALLGEIPDSSLIMGEVMKNIKEELVVFQEEDVEKGKRVTALQYYAASMLVMFLLFGANFGVRLMVEERESKTLGRVLSTRAGKVSLLAGKFLGLLLISFAQSAILIAFTRFVYGVDWGDSLPGLLLVTLCSVFAGSALMMMVGTLAKSSRAADSLGMLFIQVFTLLGGGMIPVFIMPDFMKAMARGTLNWWAAQGYVELMMGGNAAAILPHCGILAVMGCAFLAVGIGKFSLERGAV